MINKAVLKLLPKYPVGAKAWLGLLIGVAAFLVFKGKWRFVRLCFGGIVSLLWDMREAKLSEKILKQVTQEQIPKS